MKIDLKLPGGGELHIEKEPMSEDARFSIVITVIILGVLAFFLGMFLILR